jgi:hypothetical protein
MLAAAEAAGIYIAPFDGPSGDYGGRSGLGTVYPPEELEYLPAMNERFDSPRNLRLIRYYVARQAAFWNLAFWNLCTTEIFEIKSQQEVQKYGEYLASITPFDRMITTQDIEQGSYQWLSEMRFPAARKLNTVQTARGNPNDTKWQNAQPNNRLALDCYHGFPVMTTEGLWEGQGRAERPLRIIWGFYAGAAHTMWADWRFENPRRHLWGSIGKGWIPVKPLTEHVFRIDQLGADTFGDEQLKIAAAAVEQLEYWRMEPRNDLVSGSTEAYCLAEPARQYMVYTPKGGTVCLDLRGTVTHFGARWLNPRTGAFSAETSIAGGSRRSIEAPGNEDWVLFLRDSKATDVGAKGPLRTHLKNPRYFTDGSGKAIYLTGSHTWPNLQDQGFYTTTKPFDFNGYLDFLVKHDHNFIRLWRWEQVMGLMDDGKPHHITPHPWQRVGPGEAADGEPKFDLTCFDADYFNRLRTRVTQAGDRGIYVSIMLFEGWGIQFATDGWKYHPFHPANNVNLLGGDPRGNGREVFILKDSKFLAVQEAYVRKVIDAVNDLDNVLYEISNECGPYSTEWQYHMIRFIKKVEAGKAKQHPVGMTFQYEGGKNQASMDSPADWISPNPEGGHQHDPPAADGKKVILSDMDHP